MTTTWKRFRWYIALAAIVGALAFLKCIACYPGVNWYTTQKLKAGMTLGEACDLLRIPGRTMPTFGNEFRWSGIHLLGEWNGLLDPGELSIHVNAAGIVTEFCYEPNQRFFALDQWQMYLHDVGF